MGIPLRTRHREVAPGQYEFAPLYGNVIFEIILIILLHMYL